MRWISIGLLVIQLTLIDVHAVNTLTQDVPQDTASVKLSMAQEIWRNVTELRKNRLVILAVLRLEEAMEKIEEVIREGPADETKEAVALSNRFEIAYADLVRKEAPSLSRIVPSDFVTLIDEIREDESFIYTTSNTPEILASGDVIVEESRPEVQHFIQFYTKRHAREVKKWLHRAPRYIPRQKQIFREEGVPTDLVYLALIESCLNPKAVSHRYARGMWQFLSVTGKRFGLWQDWWVDERYDPEKSGRAAARYLKDLYQRLGSWVLAVAAYNQGGGRIKEVMVRANSRSFWEFKRFLSKEGQEFVPKFMAAVSIMRNPQNYGFVLQEGLAPVEYDVVRVNESVTLSRLSSLLNVQKSILEDLNPELKQGCTPPKRKSYELKVPKDKSASLLAMLSPVKEGEEAEFIRHHVQRGETIYSLANRYRTTPEAIGEMNDLPNLHQIQEGSYLRIPVLAQATLANQDQDREIDQEATEKQVIPEVRKEVVVTSDTMKTEQDLQPKAVRAFYTVKRGDTLSEIAEGLFEIRASQIRRWNGIRYGQQIYPGQRLTVWIERLERSGKEEVVHSVKRGETLWDIAERYSVSVRWIYAMNPRNLGEYLDVGQKLRIY